MITEKISKNLPFAFFFVGCVGFVVEVVFDLRLVVAAPLALA